MEQLREVFPHIPREALRRDLMNTRSAERTTENILEGRITIEVFIIIIIIIIIIIFFFD